MGFFNDIGKKTTEATSKIAKETKLKLKISENKGKISDLYEEIGKKVYEKHIKDENVNEDLKEECEKLDNLSKEIAEARNEILKLNQKRLCLKCYAEIDDNALFCPKCGEKQEDVTAEDEKKLEVLEKPLEEKEKTTNNEEE